MTKVTSLSRQLIKYTNTLQSDHEMLYKCTMLELRLQGKCLLGVDGFWLT